MIRRTFVCSLVASGLIPLALASCQQTGTNSPPVNGNPKQGSLKERTLAMNVVVSTVPFWIESREMWTRLDESEPSVKVSYGGPDNTDAQKQVEELDGLVARGLDGLVIAPADSKSLKPKIDAIAAKGIPVITYLVDAPGSKRLTYITSELEPAGEKIARFVADRIGRKGKIIISLGESGSDEQEARARGIRNAIRTFQGMSVAGTVEDKFDENVGSEQIKALLAKHKDIKAIVGCNSRSAIGAMVALKELGFKPGQVAVTGWDFDNEIVDGIKAGWVHASVAQNSEFMTYLAFTILKGYKDGLLNPTSADAIFKRASSLPDKIVVPVSLIDKQNAEDYRRDR